MGSFASASGCCAAFLVASLPPCANAQEHPPRPGMQVLGGRNSQRGVVGSPFADHGPLVDWSFAQPDRAYTASGSPIRWQGKDASAIAFPWCVEHRDADGVWRRADRATR